jgi:hypothetical protein
LRREWRKLAPSKTNKISGGEAMRSAAAVVFLACVSGPALADELDRMDARFHDSADFSAQAYYRLDFGGTVAGGQGLGFRVDNERAAALGAPSMLKVQFGGQGLQDLRVNGLDLRQAMLASQAVGGGLGGMTFAQMFAVGFAAVVTTAIVVESASADDDPPPPTGSGGT